MATRPPTDLGNLPEHDAARRRDRERGLTLIGTGLAILVAATCVRLGIWQTHRLQARRASNTRIAARLAQPPLDLHGVLAPADSLAWRRVSTAGRFDTTRMYVLRTRSFEELPGVDLVVPFRAEDGPLVFLVNRGWLPAEDGETVDPHGLTSGDSLRVTGVLVPMAPARDIQHPRPVKGVAGVTAVRWLDPAMIAGEVGAPVYPLVLQEIPAAPVSGQAPSLPRRRPLPPLDDGPHLSYALQWFAFAIVIVAGSATLAWRRLRRLL